MPRKELGEDIKEIYDLMINTAGETDDKAFEQKLTRLNALLRQAWLKRHR